MIATDCRARDARPFRARLLLLLGLALLPACTRLTPQEIAAADDAQCRGYGFAPGSPHYPHCRAILDARRNTEASRPPGSGDPAGLPIYMPPPLLPAPGEAGCMVVPIGGQSYTNCP